MSNTPDRPSIFVIDPYHVSALARLTENKAVNVVLPTDPRKSEWLQYATAVLVRSETRISAEILEQAGHKLKFIVKQGVGVDNIDLEAAQAKGIKVYNTPALNSEAVAELTIGLAFCVSRRICEFDRLIRNGEKVVRSKMLGHSLFGKTLGVIGMGNIGVEVAKKWIGAMAGSVIAFDPYAPEGAWSDKMAESGIRRVQTLEEVLGVADVVSLHVPLTSSTKNLLSRKRIALMKEGSILLNCSRGGIVDEDALLHALNIGHLFGAGLDAVAIEPPTLEAYGNTLLSHPRVVVTPHVGASTEENQEKSGLAAVQIALDLLVSGGEAAAKHRSLN